ncbi:MAG: caspase family protein [Streptosporangiaceae bacterium]
MGCGHNPADFYVHRCDDGTQAPQTGVHALIIGTSEYRYEHKRTTAYDELDDIPGAAFGAAKFAKFLSEEYHDPLGCEILTVRLLLTPTRDELPALKELGVKWQPATYNKVRTALLEWYEDCDGSAENITILYAAGHGATDQHSFTRVFLKAEEDRPNPFYYSLNVKLVEEALEHNYSQTKIIISDCCHTFVDAKHENGILIDVDDGRKTEFAHIHRKYDPLHITSGRDGADTYALGASEGTVLSYVLEQLLGSAGRIVRHPARYKERYFAITQDVMTERVSPIFQRHRKATYMPDSIPVVHGQTVDGGLHRPAPPPKFHVEFVVMDAAETDPVDVTITNSDGCEVGPERIPVQVRDPLDPQLAGYDLAATLRPGT